MTAQHVKTLTQNVDDLQEQALSGCIVFETLSIRRVMVDVNDLDYHHCILFAVLVWVSFWETHSHFDLDLEIRVNDMILEYFLFSHTELAACAIQE